MSELTKALYRKKKTIAQACIELGIPHINEEIIYKELDMCSYCLMWWKLQEFKIDSADNPVCPTCLEIYGY